MPEAYHHVISFKQNQAFFERFMPFHQPMRNDLRMVAEDPNLLLTLYKPQGEATWYLALTYHDARKTEVIRRRLAHLIIGIGLHDEMENINITVKLPPGHEHLAKFG